MDGPNLPTGYKIFSHQVAGHMFQEGKQGFLSSNSPDDNFILKPVQQAPKGEVEVEFYRALFHELEYKDDTDQQLLSFVPNFCGLVTLPLGDGLEKRHLKLEDITQSFKLPSVLDVKMGLKVWEDHRSWTKIERERKKFPLQEVIGFRILGMKVYNHGNSAYKFYDRFYGRTLLSEELIHNTLKMYVEGAPRHLQKDIALQIISRLRKILGWFSYQRKYKFIASSLLIVYESSPQILSETDNELLYKQCNCGSAEETDKNGDFKTTLCSSVSRGCSQLDNQHYSKQSLHNNLVDIRLIDFTHASKTNEFDSNFALGLEKLISFFEKIHTS